MLDIVKDNYNKVIAYQKQTNYDTRLEIIWSENVSDIARLFQGSQTAEELIDRVDQTFMYAINFPPENGENTGIWKSPGDNPHIREKQINWLLSNLKFDIFSMDNAIEESKYIHHRNKTVRNGKTLSGNFLRTMSISHEVFSYLPSIKSIIELGGGCGHQARTFLLQIPDCKYTIVDLPETLIFSFTYLSLNFPDKKCLFVTCPEDISRLDEHDIVFVPAVFSSLLTGREYDLFINTASLGEMRNDVIRDWMDFIQNRIKVRNLFTLNRFLNVIDESGHRYRLNENECSVSYDNKWNIINWELEPIYCRCPFIDTLHSRYLQIVASRDNGLNQDQLTQRSDELLQEALDEDWNRLEGYYGNGLMQQRWNSLAPDLTMNGALFKLWESIRLNQRTVNVMAMLKYLRRLLVKGEPSWQFEENFYYQKWINGNGI